jgi:hypothetical protein
VGISELQVEVAQEFCVGNCEGIDISTGRCHVIMGIHLVLVA